MMRTTPPARPGTTLVELLVVLAILGTIAAMATVAIGARATPVATSPRDRIADARRRAIAAGHPVTVVVADSTGRRDLRAMPDGRVLGGAPDGIDPMSGRPTDAPR